MIGQRLMLISIVLLFAGCGGAGNQAETEGASAENSEGTLVVTSNYPTYFYASRIAAGVVGAPEIVFPDIDGDPAFWTPGAEQIQLLQSADVVILNGAGAEPWLNLITLDRRHLIDTSVNISDRLIPLEDSVQHQHGPEGEHSHEGTAFTTWLDPQLAIAQAEVVTSALVELVPSDERAVKCCNEIAGEHEQEGCYWSCRDVRAHRPGIRNFQAIRERINSMAEPIHQHDRKNRGSDASHCTQNVTQRRYSAFRWSSARCIRAANAFASAATRSVSMFSSSRSSMRTCPSTITVATSCSSVT